MKSNSLILDDKIQIRTLIYSYAYGNCQIYGRKLKSYVITKHYLKLELTKFKTSSNNNTFKQLLATDRREFIRRSIQFTLPLKNFRQESFIEIKRKKTQKYKPREMQLHLSSGRSQKKRNGRTQCQSNFQKQRLISGAWALIAWTSASISWTSFDWIVRNCIKVENRLCKTRNNVHKF